jgi:hypothetical protein
MEFKKSACVCFFVDMFFYFFSLFQGKLIDSLFNARDEAQEHPRFARFSG